MRIKKLLAMAGFGIALLVQPFSATGTELRYIRIGEHSNYTRLVFEFSELPTYETPVVTDQRKISLVFAGTSTVLPAKIPGETTRRIEYLKFVRKNSDLTAQISLSFPDPKVTTFPLSDPPRIVMDIRQLDPQKDRPSPKALISASGDIAPPGEPGKEGNIQEPPDSIEPITRAESGKASAAESPPALIRSENPADAQGIGEPHERANRPTENTEKQKEQTETAGNRRQNISPQVFGGGGEVRFYLLAALTLLSVVTVGLLFMLVHKKKEGPKSKIRLLEMEQETGKKIARIDDKIEDELTKLLQP